MQSNAKEWTFGKSLLLLLISFEILIIAILLVIHIEFYDIIAKVAGALWGSITAVLGYIGVQKSKEISLSEFLGKLPTKMFIIAYAVIGGIFLLLAELPRHKVIITTMVEEDTVGNVEITWDGKYVGRTDAHGKLMIKGVRRGSHPYVARLEGFELHIDTIPIDLRYLFPTSIPEPVKWASSQRATGVLDIESEPSGAAIWIDDSLCEGLKTGRHIEFPDIVAGKYRLKLEKKKERGTYFIIADIIIEENKTYACTLNLYYIPPARGLLHVESNPPRAEIYVDGEWTGAYTPATVSLEVGLHELELRKKEGTKFGYVWKKDKKVEIRSDMPARDTVTFKFENRKRLYEVYIVSDPQALIYINGKYEGRTNTSDPIYIFEGEDGSVILRETGYHDYQVTLPIQFTISDTFRLRRANF